MADPVEEAASAPAPAVADPVVVTDAQGAQWTVDSSQLADYLHGGYQIALDQYQAEPGRGIAVQGGDGTTEFLPPEQAQQAILSLRGAPGTTAAAQATDDQRFYSTPLQQARAASAGLLRGGTLGLSDQALVALDPTLAPELRGLREANPNLTTASELVGAVAPVALGGAGALGSAARAVGAPVRALGAAGEAVGAGARALGETAFGTSALGQAGARAVGAAARGATEFGLFEGSREISAAALEQRDIDGEKMVALMGHGALLGAGLGAGGSLLLSGARGAGGAVADAVGGAVGRGQEAASGLLDRGQAAVRGVAEGAAAEGGALVGKAREIGGKVVDAAEGGWKKLERDGVIDQIGRDQAIKSTGANLRQVEQLRALGADMEDRVVRQVLDAQTDGAGKLLGRAQMAEKAALRVEKEGAEVGALIDKMSQAGVKTDITEFLSKQRRQVLDQMTGVIDPELRRAAKGLEETWLSEIEAGAKSGDPRKLWETKSLLGKRINWKAGTEDAANELKKDLYFGLDREITRLGTESADVMGEKFAQTWRQVNDEYRAARWVRDATEKGASSELRNNAAGMGEYLTGAATLAAAGPAGLPFAAAAMLAKNLARRYGSQAVAQLALRPGALDAMIGAVDRQVGAQVRGLLTVGKAAAEGGAKEARGVVGQAVEKATERGAELVKATADAASGAAKKTAAAARAATEAGGQAARTSAEEYSAQRAQIEAYQKARASGAPSTLPPAMQQTLDRGVQLLADKMPRRPPVMTVDPRDPQPLPSEGERARWLRYVAAVNNPLAVIDQVRAGTASREALEALRLVYPKLYGQAIDELQAAIEERGEPLTLDERQRLSRLYGLPATRAQNPATGAAVQAALNSAGTPGTPGQGGAPAQPPKAPTRPMKSPRLASRGEQMEGTVTP